MPGPLTAPSAPLRVSPYSIIDIRAFQEDPARAPDPEAEGDGVSLHVPSGYVVPVPCGYAVPCSLPALLPAYSSPVVVCAPAPPEDGRPVRQHPPPPVLCVTNGCGSRRLPGAGLSGWGQFPGPEGPAALCLSPRRLPSAAWHVVLGEAPGVRGP